MVPGVIKGTSYNILLRISNYYGGIMSFEKKTSRKQNEILCDTFEIQEHLNTWTRDVGWSFKDFATFVELIGIKTPIKLSNWNKYLKSFKCTSALGTEFTISLNLENPSDTFATLMVSNEKERRFYEVYNNSGSPSEENIPELTSYGRTIKKNDKELDSFYSSCFCTSSLPIDSTHRLYVEIDVPYRIRLLYPNNLKLKNYNLVEDYLLTLDTSLIMDEVFAKVMKLLEFTPKDLADTHRIIFSYVETVGEKKRDRSKIFMENGVIKEYAVLENRETFRVLSDGNWSYLLDNLRIDYHKDKDNYTLSVTEVESNIVNINPAKLMRRVKERISELQRDIVK